MNKPRFTAGLFISDLIPERDIACERFPYKRSAEDLSEQARSLELSS